MTFPAASWVDARRAAGQCACGECQCRADVAWRAIPSLLDDEPTAPIDTIVIDDPDFPTTAQGPGSPPGEAGAVNHAGRPWSDSSATFPNPHRHRS